MALTLIDRNADISTLRDRIYSSEDKIVTVKSFNLLTKQRPGSAFDFVRLVKKQDIVDGVIEVKTATAPIFKVVFAFGGETFEGAYKSKKEAQAQLAYYHASVDVMDSFHEGGDYIGVIAAGGVNVHSFVTEDSIGEDHAKRFFCDIDFPGTPKFSTHLHTRKKIALAEAGYHVLFLILKKWKEDNLGSISTNSKPSSVKKISWKDDTGAYLRPRYLKANYHHIEDILSRYSKERKAPADEKAQAKARVIYRKAASDMEYDEVIDMLEEGEPIIRYVNLFVGPFVGAFSTEGELWNCLAESVDDDYFVVNFIQALACD